MSAALFINESQESAVILSFETCRAAALKQGRITEKKRVGNLYTEMRQPESPASKASILRPLKKNPRHSRATSAYAPQQTFWGSIQGASFNLAKKEVWLARSAGIVLSALALASAAF